VMSVYSLTFDAGSLDCVTLQATIEHLEQAALAVKEINRVLRPGGVLIVSTDNPYYWRWIARQIRTEIGNTFRRLLRRKTRLHPSIFKRDIEYARHVYSWTPSTLLTLMVVNGFVYDEHRYVSEADSLSGALVARLLPFFGEAQVLKVRKVAEAPQSFI